MASQNTPGLNETFDLLTHPSRRYLLYHLTTESRVVDIETLATVIAQWDRDRMPTDGTDRSDRVEVALRHVHLPKLAKANLVSFDAATGVIELEEPNCQRQLIAHAARIDGYGDSGTEK